MRSLAVLFPAVFSCLALFAQNDAMEYNDMIVAEQLKIYAAMDDFNSSIDLGSDEEKEMSRKVLYQQTIVSIAALERLGAWKDDSAFRDAGLNLFNFYKNVVDNEFKEMLNILKNFDESLDSDVTRLEEIDQQIAEKEKKFDDAFLLQQDAFAKKWGFSLE